MTFVPSDVRVMAALAAILPAGTPIDPASVYIEEGIDVTTGSFPALILTIPDDERVEETLGGTGSNGWRHTVACMVIDRWETSSRTYEQLMQDTRAVLNTMVQNVSGNRSLSVTGVPNTQDGDNAIYAGQRIRRRIHAPNMTSDFGFPVINAYLLIDVWGMWEQYG